MFGLMPRRRVRAEVPVLWEETPFALFREEMDKLFNRFLEKWPPVEEENFLPKWGLDVEETEKEVIVRAETPGFELADFDVMVAGNVLTIKAEHKPANGKEEKKEERYTLVKRSITLPPGVDAEKIDATYRNGVLEVKMPRKPEALGRKVPVKA